MGDKYVVGRPSFWDLDSSWYEYMSASKEERRKMCRDAINAERITTAIVFAVLFCVVVALLCMGVV